MAVDAANAAQKTPISLLQELCALNNLTPDYKLMSVEGAVHAPTFMYRVQVGDDIATATGASKKKAKHAVAKAILDKLLSKEGKFSEGFVSDGVVITSTSLQELVETNIPAPVEECGAKNPVGCLQEKCMKERWQPPLYETEDESGLPHERVFQIACHVERFKAIGKDQLTTIGRGKSKKLAKRQAAENMLKRLEELKLIEKDEDNSLEEDSKQTDELHAIFKSENEDSDEDSNDGCSEELQKLNLNHNPELKLPDSVDFFDGKFKV